MIAEHRQLSLSFSGLLLDCMLSIGMYRCHMLRSAQSVQPSEPCWLLALAVVELSIRQQFMHQMLFRASPVGSRHLIYSHDA